MLQIISLEILQRCSRTFDRRYRWADMPIQYGSKSTAHLRFSELQQKGVWKKILSNLIKLAHKQEKISLQNISIDSSSSIATKKMGEEMK